MADPGMPGDAPLELYRGDERVWTVTLTDDDDTPLDLSGREWTAQIRVNKDRGTLLATITVDATDADEGRLTLTLPTSQAKTLATTLGKASGFWDLQADDGGSVKTWLAGKVKVIGDVSTDSSDEDS